MNNLEWEIEKTTTTRRSIELDEERLCAIVRNWAIKSQGFGEGMQVHLITSHSYAVGVIISETTVETE